MNSTASLTFPDLIYFEDYSGDFKNYFNSVYQVFEDHFINGKPKFIGVPISVQKFPLVDNIHRTFYHITHKGEVENDRQPDIRRMERIRFPKFCIESSPHNELLVWRNIRGRDTRILIFNKAEDYLTVLTERKGYNLFWTAYLVGHNHTRKKLLREYETYKKTKTA